MRFYAIDSDNWDDAYSYLLSIGVSEDDATMTLQYDDPLIAIVDDRIVGFGNFVEHSGTAEIYSLDRSVATALAHHIAAQWPHISWSQIVALDGVIAADAYFSIFRR